MAADPRSRTCLTVAAPFADIHSTNS